MPRGRQLKETTIDTDSDRALQYRAQVIFRAAKIIGYYLLDRDMFDAQLQEKLLMNDSICKRVFIPSSFDSSNVKNIFL